MIKTTTNWYDDFSCIGGACTYNCCGSAWKIPVTEEEYARLQKLEHPFRDTILDNIEGEPGNRTYKRCDGHCALLTKEGWCSMVQQCGMDVQTAVCRDFPRSVAVHGDVSEYSTEIACPVLAERMLSGDALLINEQELPDPSGRRSAGPSQAYRILKPSRDFLLGLMQITPGEYTYGKVYLIYTLLFRLKEQFARGTVTEEQAEGITDGLRSEALIEAALMQDASIRENTKRRVLAAVNALTIEDALGFSRAGDRLFSDEGPWGDLAELKEDRDRLEKELIPFLSEIEKTYPLMQEAFLTYAVFLDWIQEERERFGERLICRAFEYTMFILLALAEKRSTGSLSRERFAKIISWTDRMVIHNFHLPRIIMHTLEESKAADGAGILTILI